MMYQLQHWLPHHMCHHCGLQQSALPRTCSTCHSPTYASRAVHRDTYGHATGSHFTTTAAHLQNTPIYGYSPSITGRCGVFGCNCGRPPGHHLAFNAFGHPLEYNPNTSYSPVHHRTMHAPAQHSMLREISQVARPRYELQKAQEVRSDGADHLIEHAVKLISAC